MADFFQGFRCHSYTYQKHIHGSLIFLLIVLDEKYRVAFYGFLSINNILIDRSIRYIYRYDI